MSDDIEHYDTLTRSLIDGQYADHEEDDLFADDDEDSEEYSQEEED